MFTQNSILCFINAEWIRAHYHVKPILALVVISNLKRLLQLKLNQISLFRSWEVTDSVQHVYEPSLVIDCRKPAILMLNNRFSALCSVGTRTKSGRSPATRLSRVRASGRDLLGPSLKATGMAMSPSRSWMSSTLRHPSWRPSKMKSISSGNVSCAYWLDSQGP